MVKRALIFCTLLVTIVRAVLGQGFYRKSNVFELDASNFNEVVLSSNHTSIVEFYAPWCGHCKNLKKEYKKVGDSLKDIVQVAAVNCDEAVNRKICSKYRINSYPTILGFRPPKVDLSKPWDAQDRFVHATEAFQGERRQKQLIDFATSRIKNYVKRVVTLDKLDQWVASNRTVSPLKAVLFTKRDTLSPLFKSIAIDLLGLVDLAYFPIKSKQHDIERRFGIELGSSQLVVFDDHGQPHLFDGREMSKDAIIRYFTRFPAVEADVRKLLKRLELLGKVQRGEKLKPKSKGKSKGSKKDEL